MASSCDSPARGALTLGDEWEGGRESPRASFPSFPILSVGLTYSRTEVLLLLSDVTDLLVGPRPGDTSVWWEPSCYSKRH